METVETNAMPNVDGKVALGTIILCSIGFGIGFLGGRIVCKKFLSKKENEPETPVENVEE